MMRDNEEPWLECTVTTAISMSPRRKPALVPNAYSEMPGALGLYSAEINRVCSKKDEEKTLYILPRKTFPRNRSSR